MYVRMHLTKDVLVKGWEEIPLSELLFSNWELIEIHIGALTHVS